MRECNYDRFPVVEVPGGRGACVAGWDAIGERLRRAVASLTRAKTVLTVECYAGVDETQVLAALRDRLHPVLALEARAAMLPPEKLDALAAPFLGGDDPVFGFLSGLTLPQFFDDERLAKSRAAVEQVKSGLVLVVGCGARLIAPGDLLVYANLARWEAQNRFRRNEASNLGVENRMLAAGLQVQEGLLH